MRKNHEASFIQNFGDHLRDTANRRGRHFERFDLDGQDRNLLADIIFTDYDYFALVEGKNSFNELKSERKKRERVERLCEGLARSQRMQELHDACHFITWRDSESQRLELDVYRKQICSTAILGTACPLPSSPPEDFEPFGMRTFTDGFFQVPPPPKYAIDRSDFQEYVRWLVETVTAGDTSEVELVGRKYDDDHDEFMSIALPTLADVYALLDEYRNGPGQTYAP